MKKLVVNSYAKLNLYLKVLGRRRDGYHSLRSVFERISLCDRIRLKSRRDSRLCLNCDTKDIPVGPANLAYRAAALLRERLRLKKGLDIEITKRIPSGAGLGGGSSNAAAVILGLNKLWRLGLSRRQMAALAREIGSDVSFFVYQQAFAYVSSRGEKVRPLPALGKLRLWHILIVPKVKLSSRLVYEKWDSLPKAALTSPACSVKIVLSALRKRDLSLLSRGLFNSLETVSTRLHPEISCLKKELLDSGVPAALMSGSGGAVFAITASRKEACFIARQFKRRRRTCRVFVVSTA